MLRIIRGAGKSYALLQQLSDVVSTAVKLRDVTGQLPTDILETVLRPESETEAIWQKRRAGKIDEASIERWREDGTFDQLEAEDSIKARVLQIIASQFVGQTLQERAGDELQAKSEAPRNEQTPPSARTFPPFPPVGGQKGRLADEQPISSRCC
jgi:hypothetical protein